MLTPELYEKNITLRCLVEEASRNAAYINMALTNIGLTLLQAYISSVFSTAFKKEKVPQFLIVACVILGAIFFSLISIRLTDIFSVKRRFGLSIARPNQIFEKMLSDREVFVENDALLDEYIQEMKILQKSQSNWVRGLFTLRTLMAGVVIESGNTLMQPTLSLNVGDTAIAAGLYFMPSSKLSEITKNGFAQINVALMKAMNKVFNKGLFKATQMDVIAVSSIGSAEKTAKSGYIIKIALNTHYKAEELEKALWKLKAIADVGSRIFKKDKQYIAYLNLDMTPYLGMKINRKIQEDSLAGLQKAFADADVRADEAWKFKNRLLRMTSEYYFGCDIKHGFECDGPLDEFIFDNIHDLYLFNNLVSLQNKYPTILTQKDTGFSISLSKCTQDVINDLRTLMAPKPISGDAPSSSAKELKNQEIIRESVFSWKRWRSIFLPATPPLTQRAAPIKPIVWENAQYNNVSGEIVPIINFAQLQPIAGSLNYIYYSDEFKNNQDEQHLQNVAEQMKTYRNMIAHHDSGNGIKELRDDKNNLVGYYTSDGKSDTRIIFKAITQAHVPLESNPNKMKTIILLEPLKICTHAELERFNLNHPDLKESAIILSRKQNKPSDNGASSSSTKFVIT